jgi:hypothetical protein
MPLPTLPAPVPVPPVPVPIPLPVVPGVAPLGTMIGAVGPVVFGICTLFGEIVVPGLTVLGEVMVPGAVTAFGFGFGKTVRPELTVVPALGTTP